MVSILIFTAVLVSLMLAYAFWCLNIAYPLVLDKYIERGRSWLYRPTIWNSSRKFLIKFVTTLLFILVSVSAFMVLWQFKDKSSPWILLAIFICFIGLLLYFRTSCFNFKYQQQSDAYFYIHDRICRKLEQKGKILSQSEINNLTSFEYQNMMRDADINGNLNETLKIQCKLAKKVQSNFNSPHPSSAVAGKNDLPTAT